MLCSCFCGGGSWSWRRTANAAGKVAACVQAMADAAGDLVGEVWAGGGARDVYADFNALTLDIVTKVLFGWDVDPQQASTIVGAPL